MALEVTCHPSKKRTNQVAEVTLSFLFFSSLFLLEINMVLPYLPKN